MKTQYAETKTSEIVLGRGEGRLKDYVLLFRRGRWIIVASTAFIFGSVALYTFTTRPIYEATARVLIETKNREGSPNFLDLLGTGSNTKITNELEILQSHALGEAVAQALLDREFVDKPGGQRIAVIEEQVDGKASPLSPRRVNQRLQRVVEFTPIKESDVIKIAVRSQGPEEAALIANTYAGVYADRNLAMSRTRSRAIREFLQNQLTEKRDALTQSESALQSYMKNSGVVTLDGEVKKVVEQLSLLEASRDALNVEITTRVKTLESMKEELAKQEPNAARSITQSNDAYVRLLQEQLAQLEVQRDVLISQNPEMVGQKIFSDKMAQTDAQIEALRRNLQKRTTEFLGSMLPGGGVTATREGTAGFLGGLKQKIVEQQIELEGLNARRSALGKVIKEYEVQFNRIPRKSIDLAKFQRSRLSSEKLYLMVEEKYNEAAITESSQLGYVNVVDPAILPDYPVSPKVMLNLLVGLLMGLGCGAAVVFLKASLVVTIHTPEDLKRTGHTTLGVVSRIDGHTLASVGSRPQGTRGLLFDGHLIAALSPFSPLTESYRHLRTSIEYAQLEKPIRRLTVTSALPGEGKTTTVANLAIVCAQQEKRLLLVDADMRKPTIHTLFGLTNEVGLAQILSGAKHLDQAIIQDVVPHLDLIVSGSPPPNPAEILGSRKMDEFLQAVAARYDLVLFDSPPILSVTDAVVLSRKVDGTALVISAGTSRVDVLERATEVMERVGGTMLGVVLNRFDPQKEYGRYYGKHAYGYGDGIHTSSKEVVPHTGKRKRK